MFCKKCGTKLPDDANFCVKCGTPVDREVLETVPKASVPEENLRLVTFHGITFDAMDFMLKYDVLGRGRIEAMKELRRMTGAGLKDATQFMSELCKSPRFQGLVLAAQEAEKAQFDKESREMEGLFCPKCHSRDIHIDKKGYSLTKGVVGTLVLGPVGLIAGKHKSNKLRYTCRQCGHQWHD